MCAIGTNRIQSTKGDILSKTRINVSLDQDLAEFAKIFAMENRTTVADKEYASKFMGQNDFCRGVPNSNCIPWRYNHFYIQMATYNCFVDKL